MKGCAPDVGHPHDVGRRLWRREGTSSGFGLPCLPGHKPPDEENEQYCMRRLSVLSEWGDGCGGGLTSEQNRPKDQAELEGIRVAVTVVSDGGGGRAG